MNGKNIGYKHGKLN